MFSCFYVFAFSWVGWVSVVVWAFCGSDSICIISCESPSGILALISGEFCPCVPALAPLGAGSWHESLFWYDLGVNFLGSFPHRSVGFMRVSPYWHWVM